MIHGIQPFGKSNVGIDLTDATHFYNLTRCKMNNQGYNKRRRFTVKRGSGTFYKHRATPGFDVVSSTAMKACDRPDGTIPIMRIRHKPG